jgi:nitrous oxide reductase accessory protein NosL
MKLTRVLFIILFGITLLAGCGRENTDTQDTQRRQDPESELIRDEGTNVAALDANNDGTVYQCPMDYQVISDTLDICPVCKMDLEEYTVAEAQENLTSHYQK